MLFGIDDQADHDRMMEVLRHFNEPSPALRKALDELTNYVAAIDARCAQALDDIRARLAKLEAQQHPGLSNPDPCADGFCSIFRPIDETEGSV
jgi:hypothetical protein